MRRLAPCLAVLALVHACAHMGPSARPLYPGPVRPAEEVATLSGPIKSVDGLDVSDQGTVFALEPGCHVVVLESKIGEGGVSGAWSVDIPKHIYAFRMMAGHSYVVRVRVLPGNQGVGTANVGGVEVTAVEQDSRGKTLATVPRVRKEADVEACQAWGASLPGQRQVPPDEPEDGDKPKPSPDAGTRQPTPIVNPDAGAPDAQAVAVPST